ERSPRKGRDRQGSAGGRGDTRPLRRRALLLVQQLQEVVGQVVPQRGLLLDLRQDLARRVQLLTAIREAEDGNVRLRQLLDPSLQGLEQLVANVLVHDTTLRLACDDASHAFKGHGFRCPYDKQRWHSSRTRWPFRPTRWPPVGCSTPC